MGRVPADTLQLAAVLIAYAGDQPIESGRLAPKNGL
jgi:hypothetical protein